MSSGGDCKGGSVFSQRGSEIWSGGRVGKVESVNRSWEHLKSMAVNFTS